MYLNNTSVNLCEILFTRVFYELFIQPGITIILTTDTIKGPCLVLAVVTVKGIDNSEL